MTARKRLSQTTPKLTSAKFAVHCVNGNRKNQADGIAPMPDFPNTFTRLAAHVGTLLKRADVAPAALINGAGRLVCAATKILRTKIGMKKMGNEKLKIKTQ